MLRALRAISLVLVILFAAVAIWLPIRARRLDAQYTAFRRDFEPRHVAIDSLFHQKDAVVNGIRWHYIEEGAPDGIPILFLHGLPEGWYSWRYVAPEVDQRYRLIAIDMKGYGRSDRDDADYNWHHVAGQIADFMASLGIAKYYVVSHDWGTIIGSVLVGDFQDRILGYVRMEADLIPQPGGLAAWIQKPQWLIFRSHFIGREFMRDAGWFIGMVYPLRMTTAFRDEDRDYLTYEFSRPGVADRVSSYFLDENRDLDAALAKVCRNRFPFPVLQLQADSDPAQPPSIFADVAKACPNVKVEWVTHASHFDNFDQPKQVAEAINRFVSQSCRSCGL
jgi:pimeloyl-ACP methyl ester carboxylesterase